MSESAHSPISIELDRTAALRVRWADGVISTYPLAALRKACPCAGCRGERERAAQAVLPLALSVADQASMASADSVELVGRYALRIRWRDGHDTGIYDYELLRRLGEELKTPMSETGR